MSPANVTADQKTKVAEILKLLDQNPVPASIENRRAAARVRIRTPISVFLLALAGTPQVIVHSRNISTRGIGFVTQRPFKKGEFIVFDISFIPSVRKLILGRITFARYVRDGLYEIGAEFSEAIPSEEQPILPAHWLELAGAHKQSVVAKN